MQINVWEQAELLGSRLHDSMTDSALFFAQVQKMLSHSLVKATLKP